MNVLYLALDAAVQIIHYKGLILGIDEIHRPQFIDDFLYFVTEYVGKGWVDITKLVVLNEVNTGEGGVGEKAKTLIAFSQLCFYLLALANVAYDTDETAVCQCAGADFYQ